MALWTAGATKCFVTRVEPANARLCRTHERNTGANLLGLRSALVRPCPAQSGPGGSGPVGSKIK
eukprot:11156889-Lingulodinium_polyedra.AAC.1